MSKTIALFNGLANNGKGYEKALKLKEELKDEDIEFINLLDIKNNLELVQKYDPEQKFVICGGDGTLNIFVNSMDEKDLPKNLFYFPSGTGNDFYSDVLTFEKDVKVVEVRKYLTDLPVVTIDGKKSKFFNGVGFGIDGYCCEVADKIKEKTPGAEINYTAIAIKGLLFFFKPRTCTVTVDGKSQTYKHVWLAPVMKGKYYGGGMIPTPKQDRHNKEVSVLIWHHPVPLLVLMNFPKIFKGEHLNNKKMCEVLTGKEITVEYAKPCAAQIDGETVLNVSKVEVKA